MTRRPRASNRSAANRGAANRSASRRGAGAVAAMAIGFGVLAPALQPVAQAAPVPDASNATRAASAWLAAGHPTGVLTTGGVPDWGLTADGVFAQAAGGRGPTAGATATDQLETHLLDYASAPGGTARGAGPIAKLLVVAVVQGRDVTNFGGWNLRSELLALMNTQAGNANLGRFQSQGVGDTTNGFSQSLGIIGLARTGTVPAEAVSFLLSQQCPAGGFRLFFTGPGCTNDAAADVDATAMSVQALAAASSAGALGTDAAVTAGLDWLEGVQNADGSFTASGPSGVPNSNTSALSSQALRAAGRTDAADAASAWIRGLQIDCDLPLPALRGAVAYGPTAFDDTVAGGAIDPMYADQFVRTTSEAALGLGAPSFATLSGTTTSSAPDGFDCNGTPPPSSTTSTSTSTPAPTSTTRPGATTTAPATTTTAAFGISATSSTLPGSAVEGISQPRGSTANAGAAGLAATGLDAGRMVFAAVAFALSGLLFVEARRRRG